MGYFFSGGIRNGQMFSPGGRDAGVSMIRKSLCVRGDGETKEGYQRYIGYH